ncbi:MAG: sensor histidine kinase [Maricaulaceae bacterium]
MTLSTSLAGRRPPIDPHPNSISRSWAFIGLRTRFAVAITLAMLLPLTLSFWQAHNEFHKTRTLRASQISLTALRAGERVETLIRGAQFWLRGLAAGPVIQTATDERAARCRVRLDNALDPIDRYTALARFDRDGAIVCGSSSLSAPLQVSGRDWFDALVRGKRYAVTSTPAAAWGDGVRVVAAVPILDPETGAFKGALVATLTASALLDAVSDHRLDAIDPNVRLTLADASGAMMTPLGGGAPLDARVPIPALEAARADGLHRLEDDVLAPGRALVVTPLANGALFMVVAAPRLDVFDLESWDVAGAVIVPLIMWASALAVVIFAADFLVLRWVSYLRRIARVYGTGRLDVTPLRARRAPAEFRELADQMDEMSVRIGVIQTDLEDALDQKSALIKEIHHRVKNNLQIIVSLLNIQVTNTKDPATQNLLGEARARINALALVHKSLYEAEDLRHVAVRPFFQEFLTQIAVILGAERRGVVMDIQADDLTLTPDQAVPLALFATEAVTNAFKHAFKPGEGGRIAVSVRRVGEDQLQLSVEDDGVGLPPADSSEAGVGSSLMTAFARQLDGEVSVRSLPEGGVRVTLTAGI